MDTNGPPAPTNAPPTPAPTTSENLKAILSSQLGARILHDPLERERGT